MQPKDHRYFSLFTSNKKIITVKVIIIPSGNTCRKEKSLLSDKAQLQATTDCFVFLSDTVSKQGTHWDFKQVAAHVTFPPDAVSEDRTLTVLKWNPAVCSPPLQSNEAIVSDVIELSTDSTEGLQFNKAVKLVISHCAANLKGYEVVVKQLIDKENNTWVDIAGTVNLLSLAGRTLNI